MSDKAFVGRVDSVVGRVVLSAMLSGLAFFPWACSPERHSASTPAPDRGANPSGDILPAERRTTWNPGIPGGVPSRTTICATVAASSYGNGASDATAGIQAALDACPVGQVVLLSPGTFRIMKSVRLGKGVVLRGAGPAQTLLRMPDGANEAAVVIGVQWAKVERSVDLKSDAAKGATSATVASTAGLAAGELVLVDELTDASITRWSATSPPGHDSRGWFSRMDRPLGQVMEIAAAPVGDTVTFTTPLHIGFDTAHSAQLSRFVQFAGGPIARAVKSAGLEDLRVYGGEGGDGGGNVYMQLAAYSWVKNVESEYSKGGSVALHSSFRCIVRDSYLHGSKNPNPGGDGYGLSINSASADNLFENNISWNFNKVIVMRATGGGNVIAYNYMEDAYGAGYPTFVETGLNASHMTTPHFELFEGNEAFNIDADARWGNSVYITYFRNHATGVRRSLGGLRLSDSGNRHAIGAMAGHYWYSFIGNVLGYPGMTPEPAGSSFTYEGVAPWDDNPVPMWKLGYPDSVGTPSVGTDPLVAATAIREGNFDYATNAVHWENSPRVIPSSLYLTAKPSFFGDNPWPWVDPTGATKLHVLPARVRFDAALSLAPPTSP